MKVSAALLAAAAVFAPALAQSALPKVDLGYQIQQASSFNVCTRHPNLHSQQLIFDSKLAKYTISATSATGSLQLETCVSQLLSRRRDGTLPSIMGAWVQYALKHHLCGAR
jgi:hypothetical protein